MCHQMYGVSCIIKRLHNGRAHLARRSVEEPPIPRHVQSPHLTPIASQTRWPASYVPASFSTHGTGFKLSSFCTAAGSSHWEGRAWKPRGDCGGQGGRATATHYHSLCPSTHRSSSFPASLLPKVHLARAGRDCGGTAGVTCPAVDGGQERAGGGEKGEEGASLISMQTTI